jgi:hypothetical protein
VTRAAQIPETVTLHVPFRIVKRGGRKEMQLPEGASHPRKTDNTLVMALARAFQWSGQCNAGPWLMRRERPFLVVRVWVRALR